MKFSKAIVWAVIGLNILFTASVLYVFAKTGNEPSVLVGSWFTFTTGELWALANIRKHKLKKVGETFEGYQPIASGPETPGPETGESVQG